MATTPHTDDTLLDDMPIDGKIALVFGTEMEGLSEIAIENADGHLKIPMFGFTESFNISVSAAIILHHLTDKLRKSDIDWKLKDDEILNTRLAWVRSVLKHPEMYEQEFIKAKGWN